MVRFLLISLLCLPCAAQAQEVGLGGSQGAVELLVLDTLMGNPQEADESFLLGASARLHSYTHSTGFEACGQVCHAPDGTPGLLLTTNQSHIGCVVVNRCPTGMLPSGLGIHSHPQGPHYAVNAADEIFLKARHPDTSFQPRQRRPVSRKKGFSPYDYAAGPGYLVDDGLLIFQNGPRTDRVIGIVPPLP